MIEQAVFLVGGLGTRLGELTRSTPKPMLEVGGRPFLDYLIENARRHGLRRIALLCGFQAGAVAAHYAADPHVTVIVEDSPLGTGGALRHAAQALDDRFFLMNGDTLFDTNLLALVPDSSADIATLALRELPESRRSGWVALRDGRVAAFHGPEVPLAGPINAGIYLMSRRILDALPAGASSLEADVFPRLASSGALGGRTLDGYFIDIGIPDDYARAQTEVPARRQRPAIFFDRDGVLNRDIAYAHRPDQIEWLEGAKEAVRLVNDAGWYAFVVTNQAGVAHGLYEEQHILDLHRWMAGELQAAGAHIDRFEHEMSHPEAKVEALKRIDRRRKPGPGMLFDIMHDFPVDRTRSALIGDRDSDIAAAEAAGLRGHLYRGGRLDDLVRRLIAG